MKRIALTFIVSLFTLSGCVSPTPEVESKLTSLSLSGEYQTEFKVNDTFNYDGLIVTAHYSDNVTKVITDYVVSEPDMSYPHNENIKVSYLDQQANYMISILEDDTPIVDEVKLTSITLSGTYKTEFTVGDTFNYDGLIVTAHYNDNSSKQVTSYAVTAPDMTSSGTKYAVVKYTENKVTKDASYTVTIKEKVLESVMNEPYIAKQYYLNHIGDIFSVWKKYRGTGVTIAVIDSAFDPYHEDFVKKDGTSKISSKSASFSYNGSTVTKNVGINFVNDLSDSHGTFCAGVAGAALNEKGVIGIAPDADLMLLKTDKKPKSIVEAFKYAADNGAKVVTISIGSYYNYEGDLVNDGSDLSTVFNSATKYCVDKGVVVCSAAGNGGGSNPTEYTFPGASENVIGCGGLAANSNGNVWEGSSYNSSPQYQFCDVFAPADGMFNICNYQNDGGQRVYYDGGWQGTSFASPIVAGMAALYFEKFPNNSAKQFENALYNSCHKIDDSGHYGYGRVDVAKLLGVNQTGTVTLKVKASWQYMYVYAWNTDLSLNKEIANWPGVEMTKNGNIYTYTLNIGEYDSVIFNAGYSQSVDILASSFLDGHTYDLTSTEYIGSSEYGNYTI